MSRAIAVTGLFGVLMVLTLTSNAGTSSKGEDGERNVEFGPWTAAVNLGPIVNSEFAEGGVGISSDGLALYFQSTRHSAGSDPDLYVARRAAVDLPWEAPRNLGAVVNSLASDSAPDLSRDGHYLFFASLRSGDSDIYVSSRRDIHDDFAWEMPAALPAPVNGPSLDAGSSYFLPRHGRPQLYFASDRANGLGIDGLDIYMTESRTDGTWTEPTFVAEVNSAFQDARPAIRVDGLEMVFHSARDGNNDLFASRRNHVWEPWSAPEKIGMPINTGAAEFQAALSANGRTLYFGSTRPGGSGASDLYASTRAKVRRDHH